MDGYKVVYSELDGAITSTFFGEPMASFGLSKSEYTDIVKLMFSNAHPGCKIMSIRRCTLEEFQQ